MKKLRFLILLGLSSFVFNAYSQIAVSSYSIYALGVNSSQAKKVSCELKTFANRDIEDLIFELDGFYNFKSREYHRFSLGLGINISPFQGDDHINSFVIPANLEIFPLQDFKRISLVFELAPEILFEENMNIRSMMGIRYAFGDKE